jgi:ubiquinone/menaquinone biosynthesis C-methylase UbiE
VGTAEIANVDEARSWNGDDADHWVTFEAHYNRAVARHHERLMQAAAIKSGERVIDIGCGCGQTARDAARAAAPGEVLALDLSEKMLGRARDRAQQEKLDNVRFEVGDAQIYAFEPEGFDVAISRFGSMFFVDPVAAFSNINRALRRGGRLTIITWQPMAEQEWILNFRAALAMGRQLPEPPTNAHGPFGLATEPYIRDVLTRAGFSVTNVQPVHEPMSFGADIEDAFAYAGTNSFSRGAVKDLDEAGARKALEALRSTLASHATNEGVAFDSAAWLTTARRA